MKRLRIQKKYMILGALTALLAIGLIWWMVAIQIVRDRDYAKFQDTKQQESLIVAKLQDYLGNNVVDTREQDECFNAEQGPYDHGNLWCQVATIINLQRDIRYSKIGDVYIRIGRSLGLSTSSDTTDLFPSYTINLAHIDCELESIGSNGVRSGAARRIPFRNNEKIALAVTCASRSSEAFYPYTGF